MRVRKKNWKRNIIIITIIVVITVIVFVFMLNRYFFPSLHSEQHRGVEYYQNNSYESFGFGLNSYGKIASNYLPDYSEISEGATYIDFYYKDSSNFLYEYVFVAVGARYEEDTYESKIAEIKQMGKDFGTVSTTDIAGRLISQKRRINGEMMYYVVEYSDLDNAIMYWVVFSDYDYDEKANLSFLTGDTMIIFTEFWQYLHPITTENGDFGPKYIVTSDN